MTSPARASRRKGSSPLARGLRPAGQRPAGDHGIIPARAGFTPTWGVRGRGTRDHPRSRGVYPPEAIATWWAGGSSPLARGLPPGARRARRGDRIIPARAGFTLLAHQPSIARPDHPRSRGVYSDWETTDGIAGGSSPLARGLLGLGDDRRHRGGIIPARAGFTHPQAPQS